MSSHPNDNILMFLILASWEGGQANSIWLSSNSIDAWIIALGECLDPVLKETVLSYGIGTITQSGTIVSKCE